MTNQPKAALIVIFGITGDLSKRKLLPALYHMYKENLISPHTKIIGTSRHPIKASELVNLMEISVLKKDKVCDPAVIDKFRNVFIAEQLNPDDLKDYAKLKKQIHKLEKDRVCLLYFSVPSAAYNTLTTNLAKAGLNKPSYRILLEKPFGYDYNSACDLIKILNKNFKEQQIYRIDHYLAKETAQNLLSFRKHNPIFSSLWNSRYIERIIIRAFETIGIEGRANFYEQTGALRDFVQSHLMQLLAITMMDIPETMSSNSIHEAKLKFLKDVRPAPPNKAVRGQYEGYREEVSNPRSHVETYAKICLKQDSVTWSGSEIILETGKAMAEKLTSILVEFKSPHERRRNSLTFQIQPDEGINLDLVVKVPGLNNTMHHTALSFSYDKVFQDYLKIDPYEKVLLDAMNGDQSLFASGDEVIETWRILQPVLEKWQNSGNNLKFYSVGSNETKLV